MFVHPDLDSVPLFVGMYVGKVYFLKQKEEARIVLKKANML